MIWIDRLVAAFDAAGFGRCGFGVTQSQLLRPSHCSSTLSFFLSSTNSAMRSHRLSHLSLISKVCRPTCVSQQPPRRILLGRRSSFKFSSTLEKKIVATLEIKVTHKKRGCEGSSSLVFSLSTLVEDKRKKKKRKWVACGGVQLPLATLLPPNELTFPFSLCATKIHQFVHACN